MRSTLRLLVASIFGTVAVSCAAQLASGRLESSTLAENNQPLYYWRLTPVANTAQLLTLFSRSQQPGLAGDVPLVAVLRDTLGDANPENDRVVYVWLLTYSHLNIGQRILSAVPFFYWRVGKGSETASARDTHPFFDMTAPQHPVLTEAGRDLLQWTTLDPMTMPVRASSRAYRTNQLDYERLHLGEAISYLREAPFGDGESALTRTQLDSVIARLELRKRLLGGLVEESRVARVGEEAGFEQERIRSRNWELLRQCAERSGLLFEPIDLGGTTGEYAILWYPLHGSAAPAGTSLGPVWKLLNIHDPWSDDRLKKWKGPVYRRDLDENGAFLHEGMTSATQIELVPLGVYSLNYPRLPLLLIDFRDRLHVRRHEMTQRSINEITAGLIGVSHFTNWYYYIGADMYDFVVARHGAAMNQAARLDSYSEFRSALALDQQLDPKLREQIQSHVTSLDVNPMEASPAHELEAARARDALLETKAADGTLMARLDKQRRAELAYLAESKTARVASGILHGATFGVYTHRAKADDENIVRLDAYRRLDYQLQLLESLVAAGTQPEIAYDSSRIRASVSEVRTLMPSVKSPEMHARATNALERLRTLSRDENVQEDCSTALIALERSPSTMRNPAASAGVAAARRNAMIAPLDTANVVK
ncbi:MAG: hypothetical protein JO211_03880 [Acidobacteriaceae bacterium]|nr:hypothetical protein [Acidobacteriaceae bacterium]